MFCGPGGAAVAHGRKHRQHEALQEHRLPLAQSTDRSHMQITGLSRAPGLRPPRPELAVVLAANDPSRIRNPELLSVTSIPSLTATCDHMRDYQVD